MFVLAVDEMCKEGVGELTCPYDTSSSSSKSTPTPSTPTTVPATSTAFATASSTASTTVTAKPNTETKLREGEPGSKKGDSSGDRESKHS